MVEQFSHATMWPHGLKKTLARLSEHTKHSSIFSRAETVSRQIRHFLTRGAHVSQQHTWPHGWNVAECYLWSYSILTHFHITLNTVSRFRSEHTRHSSSDVVVAVGCCVKFSIFKLFIWDWLIEIGAVDADAFAETCDVATDAGPFTDIVAILPGKSMSSVFRSL